MELDRWGVEKDGKGIKKPALWKYMRYYVMKIPTYTSSQPESCNSISAFSTFFAGIFSIENSGEHNL